MQFHKILDHGSLKNFFFDFLFLLSPISKQPADIQKNVEGMEQPAIDPLRFD